MQMLQLPLPFSCKTRLDAQTKYKINLILSGTRCEMKTNDSANVKNVVKMDANVVNFMQLIRTANKSKITKRKEENQHSLLPIYDLILLRQQYLR